MMSVEAPQLKQELVSRPEAPPWLDRHMAVVEAAQDMVGRIIESDDLHADSIFKPRPLMTHTFHEGLGECVIVGWSAYTKKQGSFGTNAFFADVMRGGRKTDKYDSNASTVHVMGTRLQLDYESAGVILLPDGSKKFIFDRDAALEAGYMPQDTGSPYDNMTLLAYPVRASHIAIPPSGLVDIRAGVSPVNVEVLTPPLGKMHEPQRGTPQTVNVGRRLSPKQRVAVLEEADVAAAPRTDKPTAEERRSITGNTAGSASGDIRLGSARHESFQDVLFRVIGK